MNDYWLSPRRVRQRFSRASVGYDAAAGVIDELRARLLERLDLVRLAPEAVLDMGCGTGAGTRALKDRYAKAQVIGLDSAMGMLQLARKRRGWWRPFDLVGADATALPFGPDAFELVFSHLALPWCNAPDEVFAQVARVLRAGGLFMFTSLGPDTARELRSSWREVDDSVHVHAFIDMHDLGDALLRAGFADPVMDAEPVTVTYADFGAMIAELRALGVTNLAAGRAVGLSGKRKVQALRQAYEQHRHQGVLPFTVEVIYGHAWAGRHHRPQPDGEFRVPVTSIGHRKK